MIFYDFNRTPLNEYIVLLNYIKVFVMNIISIDIKIFLNLINNYKIKILRNYI